MSDLISREELLKEEATIKGYSSVRFVLVDDIKSAPSADIMECARAIKKYCEKERINCAKCPFYNRDRLLSCNLEDPCMSWNLPEGEKK